MNTVIPPGRRVSTPVVIAAAGAAAFTLLALVVHAHAAITAVDPHVAGDVLGLRHAWTTHVAQALTVIGGETVVGTSALLLVVAAWVLRGRRPAVIVAASMGTSIVLTVALKLLLGRARPGTLDRLGPVDSSYSFPSGHTLNSAVLLGLVCLTLVPLMSSQAMRRLVVLGSVVLAAGIGASRIHLGYHWTTDVIASWCVAAVIVSLARIAMVVLEGAAHKNGQSGSSQVGRRTIRS